MENNKIIIAIDGHSACGKSTLAKAMSRSLGYLYVDSGAMYRAVTLYCLQHGIDVMDNGAVTAALEHITIGFRKTADGNHTLLNGVDVEDKVRTLEVSQFVSQVSAIPEVRRAMVKQQQQLGKQKGLIMDGRDIGTVVFPDAALKIFLTADPNVRTQRRLMELLAKNVSVNFAKVKENLQQRDHIDSTRQDSPLRKAEDAIVIDNTHLTEEEQLSMALKLAEERIKTKVGTMNDK